MLWNGDNEAGEATKVPILPPQHGYAGFFIWGTVIVLAIITAILSRTWFVALLIFRYLRLIIALISFWGFYRPTHPTLSNSYGRHQVAVILPTVDPFSPHCLETVCSILLQKPCLLLIVLGGPKALAQGVQADNFNKQLKALAEENTHTQIRVLGSAVANKRAQIVTGVRYLRERCPKNANNPEIIVFADDHVSWPHERFLEYLVAPFRNPQVALVGTNKRVRRSTPPGEWSTKSIVNLVGCLYLERHNFEIQASTSIPYDNGAFVISGRTQGHRAELVFQEPILKLFLDESFFFGMLGPLNADDDNFWTRMYFQMGKKCVFQSCKEALMETELGEYPKFSQQLMRWSRTTFRSNPAVLRKVTPAFNPWVHQLWSIYSVYIAGITNFALFWDPLLVWAFVQSEYWTEYGWAGLACLVIIILGSKLVKPFAHYRRNPRDILLVPVATWMFAYVHSIYKFWSMITFWDVAWSGRKLESAAAGDEKMQARVNELKAQAQEEDRNEMTKYQALLEGAGEDDTRLGRKDNGGNIRQRK